MSELVSTRIRNTAGKLGLPHLAKALTQYAQRADEAKMGWRGTSPVAGGVLLASRSRPPARAR